MDTEFLEYLSGLKQDVIFYVGIYKFESPKKHKWDVYDQIGMRVPPTLIGISSEQLISFIQKIKD